jgi:phosphate transport system substrate-binding protein
VTVYCSLTKGSEAFPSHWRTSMRCLVFALVTAIGLSSPALAEKIVVRGSDTLGTKMVPKLAEAFRAAGNQSVEFDIVPEGSSEAFKALLDGSAQIGMSSRPIKDSERESLAAAGLKVIEHVAAVDMIAVVVNKANDVEDAPVAAISAIFTSSVATWKTANNAPILAYTRDESSGTFKVFQELAMENKEYGSSTIKTKGNDEIVAKVAANEGGVGYVGLAYAEAPGVKAIKINGIAPKPTNADTYPLSRKLYLYTIEGKLSPAGQKFIQWAAADAQARQIISDVGFIPVN